MFNPYLVIPVIAVLASWIHIVGVRLLRKNGADYKYLHIANEMPNLALVAVFSLLVTSVAVHGIDSPLAGITTVLAGLTIFQMWNSLPHDEQQAVVRRNYVVSAIVGAVLGAILSVTYWNETLPGLLNRPPASEGRNYLIIFGAAVVLAEVAISAHIRRKAFRKLPTSRRIARAIRWSVLLPAFIGFIIALLQTYTSNDYFTYRIWVYLLWVWMVVGTGIAWWMVYRKAPKLLKEEAEHFSKQQKKPKKKKSKRGKKNTKAKKK